MSTLTSASHPETSDPPIEHPSGSPATGSDTIGNDMLEYRAIYSGALLAALLGVLSVVMLFSTDNLASCLALTPIPLVGIFVSLRAWRKIGGAPELYTGKPLAIAGLALAVLFVTVGVGRAAYIYQTEVPDGYQRISFIGMRPSLGDERAGRPIPKPIAELAGQKVFIKGYIRPDSTTSRKGISQFLLVRDDNQCCFGDISQVKFYDQIAVKLTGNLRTDYSARLFRVGGTLSIFPQNVGMGADYVVYALEADHIQ